MDKDAMDVDHPDPPASFGSNNLHHQEHQRPPPPPTTQPSLTLSSTLRASSSVATLYTGDSHPTSSSSQAGPSRLPFYSLAAHEGPPHLRLRLHPKQDLISRLGLLPAFNDLVRPYIRLPDQNTTTAPAADVKGKGKEVQAGEQQQPPHGGSGHEKHEKGWRSFTDGSIGKFSSKKDTYLGMLVSREPRPRLQVRPFDNATLNGFRLDEGQLDLATQQQLGMIFEDKPKKKKPKKPQQQQPPPEGGGTSDATKVHPAYTAAQPNPQTGSSLIQPPSRQQPVPGQPGRLPDPQHPWLGAPAPSAGVGPPAAVMVNGKASKVRKDRSDEGPGAGPGAGGGGGGQQVRPHKKRKTDGGGAGPPTPGQQHRALPPPPPPQQQATPTF